LIVHRVGVYWVEIAEVTKDGYPAPKYLPQYLRRAKLPQSLRVVSHQAPSGWLTLSNGTSVTRLSAKSEYYVWFALF